MTMKVLRPAVANRLLLELICVATHRCGEFGASRRGMVMGAPHRKNEVGLVSMALP